MTALRALLILVISVCVLAGVAAAALVWWFDDDDYRRLSVWVADTAFDTELSFSGDFGFSLGRRSMLTASQTTLRSRDGQLLASIQALEVAVDLWALRRRTFLVEDLSIGGASITWTGSPSAVSTTPLSVDFLPLIQRARIANVDITIDPRGGSEPLEITLKRFDLSEPVANQPIVLKASGLVNGRDFTIDGTTGSQQDLFAPPADGFPVDLSAKSSIANAKLTGRFTDPISLRGANLTFTYNTESIESTLAPFLDIPALGRATVAAQLTGDLRAPQAETVEIHVSRPGFSLTAKGSIGSLYDLDGLDLALYTTIDPWDLDPGSKPQLRHANLHAKLAGADGALKLSDLDGLAILSSGGDVSISGSGQWTFGDNVPNPAELDITLTPRTFDPEAGLPAALNSINLKSSYARHERRVHTEIHTPDNASLQLTLTTDIDFTDSFDLSALELNGTVQLPEGTRLNVDARVDANSDGVEITAFDVSDVQSGARIHAEGGFGSQDADGRWGPIEVDLDGSGDAAHLITLLGLDGMHGISSLRLDAQLRGYSDAVRIPRLSLDIGGNAGIDGTLTGHIDHLSAAGPSGIQLEGVLRAGSTSDLGAALGRPSVPDLGAFQADARLTDNDGTLGLEALTMRVTQNDIAVLALTGSIDDIFGGAEIHWAGAADIDLSKLLSGFVDPDFDLGSLKGSFVLSDQDGSLGLESFTLHADSDLIHTSTLSGSFNDFTNFSDLEAQADIDIIDTRTLNRLLGPDHHVAGPVHVTGRVDGDPSKIDYNGKVIVGRNDFELHASIDLDASPPAISASIVAPNLYPDDLGLGRATVEPSAAPPVEPTSTARSRRSPANRPPLFSREPLALDWLDRLRLDLTLRIDSVVSDSYALKNLDSRARIARGELTIDRWNATYSGGTLSGSARLANSTPPEAELKVSGNDVAFGEVLELVSGIRSVRASMSTRSGLATHGNSLHEMASNLTGEVGLVLEHGVFPRQAIDLIGGDLFGWTLGNVTRRGNTAHFDCAIGRFSVDAGVLTTRALFLDGPNIAITGAGTIDLGAESIDASFVPKNKRRFWGNTAPVHLTGSLTDPTVTVIPARALAQGVGGLALVPQFYIPVRALGFMFGMVAHDDENSPCLTEQDKDVLTEGLPD